MKVHEASKAKKISNKDFLAEYGEEWKLKSHLSKLPEELEAELFGEEKKIEEAVEEPAQTVDSPEADLVEPPIPVDPDEFLKDTTNDECPVDLETLELSIRGLGGKSPYYKWKHLLDA